MGVREQKRLNTSALDDFVLSAQSTSGNEHKLWRLEVSYTANERSQKKQRCLSYGKWK
jgi:hypothetical protein